jgi:hypothetical protein
MGVYRTALGKQIDMSALAAKNEKTRAVGNMKINARGDTIDGHGRVIEPVTSKVAKQYEKTVGNKSALPTNKKPPVKKPEINLDEDLMKLEEEFNDDAALEMEKEKAKGKK